jgi:hypothetical protein
MTSAMSALLGAIQQQVASSSSEIVVPDGLIGYWPTDDGSGTTVTATIGTNATMSGAIGWAAGPKGIAGTAIESTADGGIARVPTISAPKPASAITFCFWWKRTGDFRFQTPMWMPKPGDTTPFNSYGMQLPLTTLDQMRPNISVNDAAVTTTTVSSPLNVWEFHCATWASGGVVTYWKNGVSVSTSGGAIGTISYYDGDLCFCGTTEYTTRWARGPVAHIRVYDRALPAEDQLLIYNAEKD